MMHLFSILPALGCGAMMIGGGSGIRRLSARMSLTRLSWIGRRGERGDDEVR
jgi:hypothetical protein